MHGFWSDWRWFLGNVFILQYPFMTHIWSIQYARFCKEWKYLHIWHAIVQRMTMPGWWIENLLIHYFYFCTFMTMQFIKFLSNLCLKPKKISDFKILSIDTQPPYDIVSESYYTIFMTPTMFRFLCTEIPYKGWRNLYLPT